MTTYTIKPNRIDYLTNDIESASAVYTIDQVAADADNFGMSLAEYISTNMDVHQDNPMDEDDLLGEYGMATIVNYMDDSIREMVHADCAPCTDSEFVREYLRYADIVIM